MMDVVRNNSKLFFFLFVYTFCLSLFISPNSWLYGLYGQCDSVVFFLEGRAWMNGAIPYVDFSDSKGPLLYLFYGIGSLLSPYDYIGVFWLSCFWYVLILYLTYSVIRLFIVNHKKVLLGVIIMSCLYFFPFWHYEFRAEDLCLPFQLLSLFYLCRILFAQDKLGGIECDMLKCGFWNGIAFAGTFLIKYTFSAMTVLTFFVVIIVMAKQIESFIKLFCAFFLGVAIVFVPFLAYFVYHNALYDFINEYFYKTLVTVSNTKGEMDYWGRIFSNMSLPASLIMLGLGCLSALMFIKIENRYRYVVPFLLLIYYGITIQNGGLSYYYSGCSALLIFGVIVLLKSIKPMSTISMFLLSLMLIVVICTVNVSRSFMPNSTTRNFFFADRWKNIDIQRIRSILKEKVDCRILFTDKAWDFYNCVSSDCSFGTKYWFIQTGATEEMHNDQIRAICNKLCNVVFASNCNKEIIRLLKERGFQRVYETQSGTIIYMEK